MKPRSHKTFIKDTAEQLEKDEMLVEDVIGFFFSAVRKTLTNMVHPNVRVSNLGTFKVKPQKLAELKKKYEAHLKVLDNPESFNQMTVKRDIEKKFNTVTKLSEIMQKEKKRKDQIQKQRNEFINNQNLEE